MGKSRQNSNVPNDDIFEFLKYDEDSGNFFWLISKGKSKCGKIAGSINSQNGYVYIQFNKKQYAAHRLAWYFNYRYMPEMIDHIDRCRTNNRLSNLRDVTHFENNKNMPISSKNTSGVIGVYWNNRIKRWRASISVDKKTIELGHFVEFSDAVNVRKNAEVLYGFHENHGKDL